MEKEEAKEEFDAAKMKKDDNIRKYLIEKV